MVTATLAARHETATPRPPPGEGAVRTPALDQRPALHIATSSDPSTAAGSISSVADIPSTWTGSPQSLSYQLTPSGTPDGQQEIGDDFEGEHLQSAPLEHSSQRPQSTFRGALELVGSNSDEDSVSMDRKGKARETRGKDDGRTSSRWPEPSVDEKPAIIFEEPQGSERKIVRDRSFVKQNDVGSEDLAQTDTGIEKWGRLRALIPSTIRQLPSAATTHAVAPPEVNIIDELITGGLSSLMLGLWFERDDKDHRRVPVLLHRLRIRISDSLHPLHAHKAVFRIECEYANGAARWVIYRQLREFISLHTHYTISNAFSNYKDKLPEFPRTSMSLHPFCCHPNFDAPRSTVLQFSQNGERWNSSSSSRFRIITT